MKIQILKSKDGQLYWRIVARNGRILATSELYKSRQGCQHTANAVATNLGWKKLPIEDLTK